MIVALIKLNNVPIEGMMTVGRFSDGALSEDLLVEISLARHVRGRGCIMIFKPSHMMAPYKNAESSEWEIIGYG